MSYLGTNKVGKMYLGDTAIGKAYLGDDLVYSSAGGGSVTPSYTALNYIKFTGSQYLMFNYYTNPNTHIEIDMQFEANGNANSASANNRWLGNYENTVMAFDSNFGGNANQYNEIFYWFNREYISSVWNQIYSDIYNRSTWIYNNNVVTFLGVNKTTETKTTTQTGKLTLGGGKLAAASFTIFNRHNLKVYSMKIYEGNTLLLDMTPKSDGTNNGLYDSVNHIFYTSQTSTNLVGE